MNRHIKYINQKGSKIKCCYRCGVELTEENQYLSHQEHYFNICRKCCRKKDKEYARKSIITSNDGKVFRGVKKTVRPDNCELCGRNFDENLLANYHHWEDDFPQLGIWLCAVCHHFAEVYDKDFSEKYISLKMRLMMKFINKYNLVV